MKCVLAICVLVVYCNAQTKPEYKISQPPPPKNAAGKTLEEYIDANLATCC